MAGRRAAVIVAAVPDADNADNVPTETTPQEQTETAPETTETATAKETAPAALKQPWPPFLMLTIKTHYNNVTTSVLNTQILKNLKNINFLILK